MFVILITYLYVMKHDLQSLTTDEKIKLAEELWKNIEIERSASLTPVQQKLLEKRIQQHQQNPDKAGSWKEIRKKYFN